MEASTDISIRHPNKPYNKANWLAETGNNDVTTTKIWIAQ